MGWFGKKAPGPAKAPTRWTPELWNDVASGAGERFDAAVIIRAMKESGEWIYSQRRMDHNVEYRGTLERMPDHPLADVPVDLRFDIDAHPTGSRHGDSQTLGIVYTGAYGDVRTGFPLLSVRIWGDAAGAAAFEAAFMRALAGGHDGLRVWLWADRIAPTNPESPSGFAAIQPVTRIKFDQSIRLGGRDAR
ncbi:hypothetical protein ASG63_08415 [Methylobacterium sp. Leaf94]|uniref:hypothetical protein n=1 Tax=Methylobacterium sp. Leaf94 TaxID=1736250 RepID=UPI0006F58A84|nr:hypothetical protein [Methylobacterium sp. Leaf94]KQU17524.1 hypothetical protein ASG63_08415 [Methylobacterium sp. Leaf94]